MEESNVAGEFHAMDCTDIVVGMAIGSESRVGDYYTRDRSTPRHDEFYGGTQSLTAALGREVDGVTTIMFRKKIDSECAGAFRLLHTNTTSERTRPLKEFATVQNTKSLQELVLVPNRNSLHCSHNILLQAD